MKSKPTLLQEISDLIRTETPFVSSTMGLDASELSKLLDDLKEYRMPINSDSSLERPPRLNSPHEGRTRYRARMAEYIEKRTKILIPARPTVNARFYDEIADYLQV